MQFSGIQNFRNFTVLMARLTLQYPVSDALTMVDICYALTLSSSMISYSKNIQDEKVFEAIVQSMVSHIT